MRPLLRSARRKILGVLDRRERVIQIKSARTAGRERFVTCHEVAHDIFPWQADLAVVGDNRQSPIPNVTAMFEREANQGAAEILFQQDLLRRMARDYPISISTPLELAVLFGSSIHATFSTLGRRTRRRRMWARTRPQPHRQPPEPIRADLHTPVATANRTPILPPHDEPPRSILRVRGTPAKEPSIQLLKTAHPLSSDMRHTRRDTASSPCSGPQHDKVSSPDTENNPSFPRSKNQPPPK